MTKKTIQMNPVKSSQIAAVGYHPETKTLAITFKSGGTYHYSNVEQKHYDDLINAKSIGSHFYKNIKPYPNDFPYQKQAVVQTAGGESQTAGGEPIK